MNKSEKRRLVTKTFLTWVEQNYDYIIDDEGMGGRIDLYKNSTDQDSFIQYSRGDFSVDCLNWAPAHTQYDCEMMQKKLDKIVEEIMAE